MKINKGITTGNIIQITVMLLGLAVLWGSAKTKIDYIEQSVSKKADRNVVEMQFKYISKQLDELEILIKERD